MFNKPIDIVGSYRQTYETGLVTTVAAGTSTAGFLYAMRWTSSALYYRLRELEVEFFLTTAFGAAQEVGFDLMPARAFTASCTGGTALAPGTNDGKVITSENRSLLGTTGDQRIATTGALTAGTHTLDGSPICKSSYDASAIRTRLGPLFFDFKDYPLGGILFGADEGMIMRNLILMGATGVGKWRTTWSWDEVRFTP